MRPGSPARADATKRFLGGFARSLGWRRTLAVLVLSVVFSTQLLAQPSVFLHWTPSQVLEGWLVYFAEIALVAATMLLGFAVAENATPDGGNRILALCLALPVGAGAGYAIALKALYPDGFGPTPLEFAGDTLRFSLMGGAVAFIHLFRRRAEDAARNTRESRLLREEVDMQATEARLRLMEAQIEPHFLFNTLANVQRLFETEPQSGRRLLDNLKEYLAGALPQMRESRSTLGREADFVRAYLEILGARMGDRLKFSVDVPAGLSEQPFPPMMLITLVENAIKHGLHPSADGGWIRITARVDGASVAVDVADSGVGFPKASAGPGIGLSNVRARLSALFGRAAAFSIRENVPTGVVATISVPVPA